MTRFVTLNLVVGFTLVALFGMGSMAMGCGDTVLHSALGMKSCPDARVALTHHIDAFVAAFTALGVAITLLLVFPTSPIRAVATTGPPRAALRRYMESQRDSITPHLPHQLFRRGILHRKDAPAIRR
ncbi:MAG: hypothetical protein A2991_04085 [Candidatus Terrybacteria bacterium RIFCSPLOWO2_01_FULL_58_14]|uniref:Uncharacterized protein n=2 Tax=Candidatus Terryibacteriota TaxID=1817920 RepID=A0A1G2Q014_9BACT|nr:MAG: hypothetical protein A2682_00105 [Candidatus Terrybacteria bacterium RIFCSPHIGHO2_01_FULL_58_15]OHA53903.1 MAG: hypothetical protein A2991_04085 [Candidatus Terrybacteria bacterium RIFCSPLOWO2_01_FULL_58_14]